MQSLQLQPSSLGQVTYIVCPGWATGASVKDGAKTNHYSQFLCESFVYIYVFEREREREREREIKSVSVREKERVIERERESD